MSDWILAGPAEPPLADVWSDSGMAQPTPPTRDLIGRAMALADEMGHGLMGSEHLLLAMTEADESLAARRILRETGALPAVRQHLDEMFGRLEPQ